MYTEIRTSERALNLPRLLSVEGITKLVEFTFDHMLNHQDFVANRGGGEHAAEPVPEEAGAVAERRLGPRDHDPRDPRSRRPRRTVQGRRRCGAALRVDPVAELLHLSNRYTLSFTYETDLGAREWIARRRIHVTEMVLSYLSVQRHRLGRSLPTTGLRRSRSSRKLPWEPRPDRSRRMLDGAVSLMTSVLILRIPADQYPTNASKAANRSAPGRPRVRVAVSLGELRMVSSSARTPGDV